MPMVVTDPTIDDNPIVYVNQSFIDLFGYSREEVLGQTYFFLAGPDTDPEVERHIRAAMMADEPLDLEVRLRAKDGREVWAAKFVSPVHDAQGARSSISRPFWTSPAGSGPSAAPSA